MIEEDGNIPFQRGQSSRLPVCLSLMFSYPMDPVFPRQRPS